MRKGSLSDDYVGLKATTVNEEHKKIDQFEQFRFRSMIAIGNPIVDISNNVSDEVIKKYNLKWGETIFANESNVGFLTNYKKIKMLNIFLAVLSKILLEQLHGVWEWTQIIKKLTRLLC